MSVTVPVMSHAAAEACTEPLIAAGCRAWSRVSACSAQSTARPRHWQWSSLLNVNDDPSTQKPLVSGYEQDERQCQSDFIRTHTHTHTHTHTESIATSVPGAQSGRGNKLAADFRIVVRACYIYSRSISVPCAATRTAKIVVDSAAASFRRRR